MKKTLFKIKRNDISQRYVTFKAILLKLVSLVLISILASVSLAQEIKSTSQSYSFDISKDPPKPPYLTIVDGSLQFIDSDGNNIIDANETTHIKFQLKNSGVGDGLNLKAVINEKNYVTGLDFAQEKKLGTLKSQNSLWVELPVKGKMNLIDSKANFSIAIDELNGFGIDPVFIEINTRKFINPVVKIADYAVTSEGSSTLVKKKPFEVQLLVQNIGRGNANNVSVNLKIPQNMFCLSDNLNENIGGLSPGKSKLLSYSLIATNNYTQNTIPLQYKVIEIYGKYGEEKLIELSLNQPVSSKKLTVEGTQQEEKEIQLASLSSPVDKNIPYNSTKEPKRFALIIGNEDYSSRQTGLSSESDVEFARNDAQVFKKYCENTLGVPSDNITLLTDATAGEMSQNIELKSKLISKIPGSELIFYYAGHGFPDENTKIPYLIPVDVNATNLSSAIKLSEVYQKFGNSGAKRITIFLDACFSGGGREAGLLAARAVKIAPKENVLSGNIVVFTASSGEQSALPYKEKQHGMFTYFLLKKLQATKGDVAYSELDEYLKQNVSVESLRVNKKEQDPKVNISINVQDTWQNWKLR